MPAKWFICPDGSRVEISVCLENGCHMAASLHGGRCLSVRTLRLIAEQRPWKGVTQHDATTEGYQRSLLGNHRELCT